jgi:hypothetical protein
LKETAAVVELRVERRHADSPFGVMKDNCPESILLSRSREGKSGISDTLTLALSRKRERE